MKLILLAAGILASLTGCSTRPTPELINLIDLSVHKSILLGRHNVPQECTADCYDKVEAQWTDTHWYPATIMAGNVDDTYRIEYNGGEFENEQPPDRIRHREMITGNDTLINYWDDLINMKIIGYTGIRDELPAKSRLSSLIKQYALHWEPVLLVKDAAKDEIYTIESFFGTDNDNDDHDLLTLKIRPADLSVHGKTFKELRFKPVIEPKFVKNWLKIFCGKHMNDHLGDDGDDDTWCFKETRVFKNEACRTIRSKGYASEREEEYPKWEDWRGKEWSSDRKTTAPRITYYILGNKSLFGYSTLSDSNIFEDRKIYANCQDHTLWTFQYCDPVMWPLRSWTERAKKGEKQKIKRWLVKLVARKKKSVVPYADFLRRNEPQRTRLTEHLYNPKLFDTINQLRVSDDWSVIGPLSQELWYNPVYMEVNPGSSEWKKRFTRTDYDAPNNYSAKFARHYMKKYRDARVAEANRDARMAEATARHRMVAANGNQL